MTFISSPKLPLPRKLADSLVLWTKRTTVREYRERTGRLCHTEIKFAAVLRLAPILPGYKTNVSRGHFNTSCTQNSAGPCATPRISPQFLPQLILEFHSAPVDITVDKGPSTSSEKPQQNQHFKYHRLAQYPYHDANKSLIAPSALKSTIPRRPAPIVTPMWNMHRFGAACSLNVTNIGICLSRQHLRFYRNRVFFAPEIYSCR